jgi:hypothetical protein
LKPGFWMSGDIFFYNKNSPGSHIGEFSVHSSDFSPKKVLI